MPSGKYLSVFVPPIQGEFRRLLLGVHGDGTTLSAARQLDFGEYINVSAVMCYVGALLLLS
jgi:hypothetical protein